MFPGDLLRNAMAPVKTLVSKKKRRLVEDGFNLDLSYITDRIIAMGFPANNFEALYRNDADEVVDFLWDRHGDRFFVYNLCRERRYDQSRFAGRLQHVPLRDHHPPPLAAIRPFCEHAHDWLTADDEHVIVVHCKAGKGRTGVMVCSYLLYAGLASSPEQAMELFAQRRTSDGKGNHHPQSEALRRLLLSAAAG
ncbi:Phosphatidylinositol 3,4,5-trisphosphate 3-phosphatase and dual-specificity protein phosphatase PTEN [Amphibalanus amphitrite]|uniref:Phosphatidylinositol 3,4,5-trisphosphate 3-phosphatase and dual-specificity protein phosphatase PTEN n=1 Tax=Amphibalanus amphitrite TaxID=1232801 RepID=A0A6A4X8E4_AMPAM|nr:Phosphatidylinositol 3,4,5-trisphosphate 3-phosphatase and dual-specificity protein phosphatase PTEN [Amphibalanus amphitrite]